MQIYVRALFKWSNTLHFQNALTHKVMHEVLHQVPHDRVRHGHHHQRGHDQVQHRLGQRNRVSWRGPVVRVLQVTLGVRVLKDVLHPGRVIGVERRVTGAHPAQVGLQSRHHGACHRLDPIHTLMNKSRWFIHKRQDLREKIAPVLDGCGVA